MTAASSTLDCTCLFIYETFWLRLLWPWLLPLKQCCLDSTFSSSPSFCSLSSLPLLSSLPHPPFCSFSLVLSLFPFHFPLSSLGKVIDQLTDLGQAGRVAGFQAALPGRRRGSLPEHLGWMTQSKEEETEGEISLPPRYGGTLLIPESTTTNTLDMLISYFQFIFAGFFLLIFWPNFNSLSLFYLFFGIFFF